MAELSESDGPAATGPVRATLAARLAPVEVPDSIEDVDGEESLLTQGLLSPASIGAARSGVILLVEDSPDDRELIEWAFEECLDQIRIQWVRDGREALDYVLREGVWQDPSESPRPQLILLDLRMPGVDGFEVLERIRATPRVRTIPIVVFSGSEDETDVRRAYESGANSYITKPSSMEGYRSVIRVLEAYWLRKVEMPKER